MQRLINGYKKFQSDIFAKDLSFFQNLKRGQTPEYMVLSCCDSRVVPSTLFQCEEGILFQQKNVANIVYPYNQTEKQSGHDFAAAVEYAVNFLKVKEIIILGHEQCGGIAKLIDMQTSTKPEEFPIVADWVHVAQPAFDKAQKKKNRGCFQELCAKENILQAAENIMTYPFVKKAVEAGQLHIQKLYVHMGYEDLEYFDPEKEMFVSLKEQNKP